MHLKIRYSLLMTLGIVMATITLLAFTSMAVSLFIADTIQGQATAINESGALRMRSYKIASSLFHEVLDDKQHWQSTLVFVNEFEQHLHSPHLTNALPDNKQHQLRIAYEQVEQQWHNKIEPLFDIYLNDILDSQSEEEEEEEKINIETREYAVIHLRNRYFLLISDFVNSIDNLVSLLEQDSESKIQRLRIYQFIALALTIILVITALILVYKRVHIPMQKLLIAAERASKRDFSFRTNYTSPDELGQLGQAFNTMAEDLSEIYNELEERVQQKTLDLERSNHSMELLYKTVQQLNEAISPHTTFQGILKDIEQLIGTGHGTICLSDAAQEKAVMLATTLPEDDFSKHLCEQSNCQKCLGENHIQLLNINDQAGNQKQIITIPISDQNQQYGVLIIQSAQTNSIETWQQQLLESIAGHIGIAIKLSQQAAETRRLALMEERGAIARELHDSLAQSLTFMKIQVSRLQSLLEKPDKKSDAKNVIGELRVGLNSAYRELRELLTTFRLKIDGESFNEALLKTITEFNDRSKTNINYDNQITYCDLTANEEIHILQLIREALSNIVQHANASSANLTLQYNSSGEIQIIIEDNGTGLASDKSHQHHYGLSIMNERAQSLNGHLDITNKPEGGTKIELAFSPINKTAPINVKSELLN
jgi:two-component system, NarL family, nitrate/nitrite sensor histidine kinase NarX